MTPHEKAKDIYQKMFNNMPHPDETNAAVFIITKQCALIAVDEILKLENINTYNYLTENKEQLIVQLANSYWEEVKQEIEKL